MATYLRSCSGPLALALAGGVALSRAKLFKFVLADGVTTYYWAAWNHDLTHGGQLYTATKPWVECTTWNVSNKMEVPNLKVTLAALNDGFSGGANIKLQIHDGLFDGATVLYTKVFMETPNDTDTLGGIDLFGGYVADIDLDGLRAKMNCKGKITTLAQNTPRNIYQIPCNHAFCDPGCTLLRASFTTSYVTGSSGLTRSFIPWSGSPPANPGRYANGTVSYTSGPNSGSRRNVQAANSSGLSLAYPLNFLPSPGDTFTAFEGCNKAFNDGVNIQDCTARSNTQHHRGFEFVPPPNAAY